MFVPEEVGDMSLALFRFIKLPHPMYPLLYLWGFLLRNRVTLKQPSSSKKYI